MLLLLLLIYFFGGVVGDDDVVKITNVYEFKNFVSDVNMGTTYSGTTVFLDSDITLSGSIDPIGLNTNYQFRGTFDGQGHIISDLKISSSSGYAGLFGYSDGLTIRNVVLDDSCTITNSFSGSSYAYVGGIIGYCRASNGECNIENSVNMAAVTSSGYISSNTLSLGGIVGDLSYSYSSSYDAYVKNSMNYGSVTHSGTVENWAYLGGIVGDSYKGYIQNCFNYGTITHNGKTFDLKVGGIAGYSDYASIENCVSAGRISTPKTASKYNYIGSIVGYIYSDTYIDYCYYTSEVGVNSINGHGTPSSTTGTHNSTTAVTTNFVGKLNNYATSCSWNKWLLNIGRKVVSFALNSRTNPITMNSQIILLPSLASGGNNTFDGWYVDSECTNPLKSFEVTGDTTFYGLYGVIVVVTFDANGGGNISFTSKKAVTNSTYGALPETTREEYTFNGWFTERSGGSEVTSSTIFTSPPSDHTLYAQWTINNYTLTFDFDNGVEKEVRIIDFNSSVDYPPNPEREGCTFNGWDKSDVEFMPAQDLTITAQWTINNYTLTFDFGNGTEKEVRTVDFNSSIDYPPSPGREGYTFKGWNSTYEFMPAQDLTITAIWEKTRSASSSSSLVLAMGITIPILLIVIVVFIVIFLLTHKKLEREINERTIDLGKPLVAPPPKGSNSNGYSRGVAMSKAEVEGSIPAKASRSALSRLYTKDYPRPTMKEALLEAKLTDEQIQMVCKACDSAATIIADEGTLFGGFTKEDVAALAMYTYDFGPSDFECNPYRIINRSIVERNYASMQKASGLLYLVMSALRKLPRVTGETLYRGVRSEVSLDKDYYHKGNVIMWPALSSTSPDIDTTKTFLARGSKSGKATGTLFTIEGGWGYDIQPYSLFPDEAEILVEPERRFEVTGVIEAEGLTIINLKMLDTPLILPEVFGDAWH